MSKRTRTQRLDGVPSEDMLFRSQRRRFTKRRGLLARMMQLPGELVDMIQQMVINTQIRLAIPRRQLLNNPDTYWGWSAARRMGFNIRHMNDPLWETAPMRFFGWGGGGEFNGWEENIRRHLYALNTTHS